MTDPARAALLAAGLALLIAGCAEKIVVERVLHRPNCEVCHSPLDEDGRPHGIEEAHPGVDLSCTDCHGGNAWVCDGTRTDDEFGPGCDGEWVYDKARAHPPRNGAPEFLKNLSSTELDGVDRAWLRFINPGDLRVAEETCGRCHGGLVQRVRNSTMGHTAGEIAVARYRAGAQPHPRGIFGGAAVSDPEPDGPCGVPALSLFDPVPLNVAPDAGVPTVAEAQDQYMVKSCFRCHLNDFGENKFAGDYRSSGCTACHMPYADDGRSRSADPTIDPDSTPHPEKHQLTAAIGVDTCTACHYRGGRIGIGFQGYREGAGRGLDPPNVGVLGEALHGHDAAFYVVDEDTTNDFDETPPDVHFEAGMHCIDCHLETDVHGNGHIYADTTCAVTTRCVDCHGTVRERARPDARRDHIFEQDGKLMIRTKVTNKVLEISQLKDLVTPGHPSYSAAADQSMGVNDAGYSHTDDVACVTCHAAWIPSCYGCHVEIDMARDAAYHTTGARTAGAPAGDRRWVQLFDLVLMRDSHGRISPSMPAERFFMTLLGDDGEPLFETQPRTFTFPDGRTIAGFGQRAFNPHTTRSKSPFQACDRCHTKGDPAAPDNAVLLDITYGFGTDRFMQEGCDVTNETSGCHPDEDWTTYRLDAIQTREGEPLVVVGHPDPQESRPLTLEEIDRMRAIPVPDDAPISTPIPDDAATNPFWPAAIDLE